MYKELNMIGYLYQWVEVNFEGQAVSAGISISARIGDSRQDMTSDGQSNIMEWNSSFKEVEIHGASKNRKFQ